MTGRIIEKSMTWTALLVIGSLVASIASAQAFYETAPTRKLYIPSQGGDLHLFNVNPAVIETTNRKAGAYVLQNREVSTFTATDDVRTTTKTKLTQDAYGATMMFDLGAGTAVGLTMERIFSRADMEISTIARVPYELMDTQTIMAQILIDLAPGLRAGLALRWQHEQADIMGNAGASITDDRIHYKGSLIGHGGGVSYTNDKVRIGAAYYPAARGKSEVLSEQRIITEPGIAILDGIYRIEKHAIGLGVERAIHKRDERSEQIPSEDGNRTVTLNGISPIKNVFPINAYHLGGDYILNTQWGLRFGLVQRTSEFIFDDLSLPSSDGGGDKMTAREWKVGLRLLAPFEMMAGYSASSYSATLTEKSGRSRSGATFEGSSRNMFLSGGIKF